MAVDRTLKPDDPCECGHARHRHGPVHLGKLAECHDCRCDEFAAPFEPDSMSELDDLCECGHARHLHSTEGRKPVRGMYWLGHCTDEDCRCGEFVLDSAAAELARAQAIDAASELTRESERLNLYDSRSPQQLEEALVELIARNDELCAAVVLLRAIEATARPIANAANIVGQYATVLPDKVMAAYWIDPDEMAALTAALNALNPPPSTPSTGDHPHV